MASVLKDYYNTGSTTGAYSKSTTWLAQTFTAGSTYSITSVKLLLYRSAAQAPGTVTVSIRAVGTSPYPPITPDLTSGTTDGNTLTANTAGEWREITFSTPITLVSGTRYAIVLRCAGTQSNPLYWRVHTISSVYPNGDYCTNTYSGINGLWGVFSGYDCMFETWGTTISVVSLIGAIDIISGTGGELNGIFGFGLCTVVIQPSVSGLLNLLTSCNGAVSILSTVTGKLGSVWLLAGSVVVQSSVSGVMTFLNIIRTRTVKTYRRLTAIGNSQFWYEDI